MEEQVYKDYVLALKAHDKPKTVFLSFVRAELKNAAIDLRKKHLDDHEVLAVLKKQKKRLQDSKDSMASSGRQDLLDEVERELALVQAYLPEPLSEEELTVLVEQVISELEAASMKDMGRVMKEVVSRSQGRADSKKVSELVRSRLSSL